MKRWSRKHAHCIKCGENVWPHHARGLCIVCYSRDQYGIKSDYRPRIGWARYHEKCMKCGTDSVPHKANGLCNYCYREDYLLRRKSQ